MWRSVKRMRHQAKAQRESRRDDICLSGCKIRLMTRVSSIYDAMQVNQDSYISRLWVVNVFYWISKHNFQTHSAILTLGQADTSSGLTCKALM